MSDTPKQDPERERTKETAASEAVPGQKQDNSGKQSKRGRGAPVFIYLAIMFAVAFFMLLLAYFMQQRNNEVTISGLRDSISQFQSLDELRAENENLREANEQLQSELDQAQTDSEELRALLDETLDADAEWRQIYTTFLLLEAQFREENYTGCAQLISTWEDLNITIPDGYSLSQSGTEYDFSARYREICDQLIEMGYLVEADDGTLSLPDVSD